MLLNEEEGGKEESGEGGTEGGVRPPEMEIQ